MSVGPLRPHRVSALDLARILEQNKESRDIEDALRGRTTARPPLVNGLGLNRRLLEADFGSGLGGLRHTLEALVGILEAF